MKKNGDITNQQISTGVTSLTPRAQLERRRQGVNESGGAVALATCVVPDPGLQDLGHLPQVAIREGRSRIVREDYGSLSLPGEFDKDVRARCHPAGNGSREGCLSTSH